jgi:hypothetical protein
MGGHFYLARTGHYYLAATKTYRITKIMLNTVFFKHPKTGNPPIYNEEQIAAVDTVSSHTTY